MIETNETKQDFEYSTTVRIFFLNDKQRVLKHIKSMDLKKDIAIFKEYSNKSYFVNIGNVNLLEIEEE